MKRALLTALALSTFAIAGSAAAQPWGGPGRNDEGRRLEMRIDRAAERGDLSRREARSLLEQVEGVRRLEWRYSRDGLSRWEANDIARRYDGVRARLRWERSDGGPGPRPWR